MVSNVSNNVNALNVYSEKLNVNATNIANASNEDYKSIDARVENRSNGDQLALKLRTNDYQTDLNVEIPEVQDTKYAYSAQLSVLKAQDDVLGQTIDLIA